MTGNESERTTDFHEINSEGLKEKSFPGSVKDEFRVHFTKNAYIEMMDHAGQTDEVELGGVLIGELLRDSQGPYLSIIGSIPAEGANNYGAQITFTHDSWNYINKVKDEKYPDNKIVGWYHTHPGFGVFLSSMDSFIQENFFNQPFQIAIVIETRTKAEGCFAWIKGKPSALERYWCGEKEVRLETGAAEPFHDPDDMDEKPRESRRFLPGQEAGYNPKGFGMSSVMMGILFCLVGFLAGQWMSVSRTSDIARMVAESETAAAFEYAGLSTMMVDDLRILQSNIDQSLLSIKNQDANKAEESLKAAKIWADKKLADYESRQSLRGRIREVLKYRGYLGMRLEEVERQQLVQDNFLAEIYMKDLIQMLEFSGLDSLNNLTKDQKLTLKNYVDRIIQLNPSFKSLLQKQYPELMDILYPSSQKKQQQEEIKNGNG